MLVHRRNQKLIDRPPRWRRRGLRHRSGGRLPWPRRRLVGAGTVVPPLRATRSGPRGQPPHPGRAPRSTQPHRPRPGPTPALVASASRSSEVSRSSRGNAIEPALRRGPDHGVSTPGGHPERVPVGRLRVGCASDTGAFEGRSSGSTRPVLDKVSAPPRPRRTRPAAGLGPGRSPLQGPSTTRDPAGGIPRRHGPQGQRHQHGSPAPPPPGRAGRGRRVRPTHHPQTTRRPPRRRPGRPRPRPPRLPLRPLRLAHKPSPAQEVT